jgi:replicative DNA helicase
LGSINIAYTEQSLIANMLRYPMNVFLVEERYFVSDTAKSLFKGIRDLVNENMELTSRNLVLGVSKYDESVKEDFLDTLHKIESQQDDFAFLYRSLRKSRAQVDIQNALVNDVLKESAKKEMSVDKITEFRDLLTDRIDQIAGKESLLLTTDMWFDKYETALNKRRDGNFFYSTGDSDLDQHLTTAFEPGYFNILAGHSGIGKSTFALMLTNKQINRQIPSLRISNEMTEISDMDRLIAMRNRLPIKVFYPHRDDVDGIPDHVFSIVKAEREKLSKCRLFRYAYVPDLDLNDVEFLIKQAKKEMGVDYLSVTIDLLTKLSDFNGDNKASKYEDGVNKLDTIAKKTNSSILGVVQLRRPSDKVNVAVEEDLEKFRPQVQEIKNAGALEERSRIVFTIFRKKYWAERYFKNDDPILETIENVAEIEILKQNLGNIGSRVKYLFEGECAAFHKYVDSGE